MFQFKARKIPKLWSSSLLEIAIIFSQYNSIRQKLKVYVPFVRFNAFSIRQKLNC